MSKASLMLAGGLCVVVILVVIWVGWPSVTWAHCGEITSSCYICHLKTHPVHGTTAWHSVYGHWYACWNCHGGNDVAQDKGLAHVGLVPNPLAEASTSCSGCHPQDYEQRADQFAKLIGVAGSLP